MGKLRSGILGQIRGKVAGVVGGQWKDVNYVREFVKPANPNTAAQQTQRAKFGDCVSFARPLVGPVFNAYTDIFFKGMSGFNAFIKSNIALFGDPPTWASVKVTEGKLYLGTVTVTDVSASSNTVTFTWGTATGNNGLATDKIFAVAFNEDTGATAFPSSEDVRSNGGTGGQIAIGSTADDTVHVWLFAIQKSGTQIIMISNSAHDSGVSA
jgi:hypothetical protein